MFVLSEEKIDVLRDLYLNFKLTQTQLSKIFNVCPRTIGRWLKNLDIIRSRSESICLSWKNGIRTYNTVQKKGKLSPRWKGGRLKDSRGYIRIHYPNHPRTTKNNPYILEHILVWEKTNNKFLPSDFIIHHLNGIRDDNRPENLFAIPRKKHISMFPNTYIRALQERIKDLERRLD